MLNFTKDLFQGKKGILLAFLITVFLSLQATVSYGQQYSLEPSTKTFTPLTGGTRINDIEVDDANSKPLSIGFDFVYFGNTYSQLVASSNGFVSFNLQAGSYNGNIMNNSSVLNIIALLWDDISGDKSTASYLTTGTAPNRVMTIEWLNYKWNYEMVDAAISFQLKLYETTNKIEFIYRQESGATKKPSASIGLVGSDITRFYSLSDPSATPKFAPNGFDLITTKPATNQCYTFTPIVETAITPSLQATNLILQPTSSSLAISWTKGNGTYRAVFMKRTSATDELISIADASFYRATSDFGSSLSRVGSSDWYCIYNGDGTSTTVTGLSELQSYRVQVIEYNGLAGAQKYKLTSSTNNPANTSTVEALTPTVAASNITAETGANIMKLSWTPGNGERRLVFMKEVTANPETVPAVNGTEYSANPRFGSGSQVGTTGWRCVYKGTDNTVSVTNLKYNTSYQIQVVEANGLNTDVMYQTTASTNNPRNITTIFGAPDDRFGELYFRRLSSDEVEFNSYINSADKAAIFIKETNLIEKAPAVDNTTYTANTISGSGSQIGTSGWYCVSNSNTSDIVTITGLKHATDYTIHIVQYNGSAGSEKYNTDITPFNIIQFKTPNKALPPQYTFTASSGSFTQITGGTRVSNIEDYYYRSSLPINIGFDFTYGGITYNSLRATSAGILNFNPYNTDVVLDLSSSLPRPVIAPFAGYSSGVSSEASYKTEGTSPNRVFTFQWLNWKWNYTATAPNISYQVKLYETSNKIEFIYKQEAGTVPVDSKALIGLAFANKGDNNFMALANAGNNPSIVKTGTSPEVTERPVTNQVYTFIPMKYDQTITFDAIEEKILGTEPFNISATASSELPVTFSSANPSVASVEGNTITMHGAGETVITAQQVGDGQFNAAQAQQTFKVVLITEAEYNLAKTLDVYPNPTIDFVTIESEHLNELNTLTLNDSQGKKLKSFNGVQSKFQVDLRNLKPGVYFLLINNGKQTTVKKIIKK